MNLTNIPKYVTDYVKTVSTTCMKGTGESHNISPIVWWAFSGRLDIVIETNSLEDMIFTNKATHKIYFVALCYIKCPSIVCRIFSFPYWRSCPPNVADVSFWCLTTRWRTLCYIEINCNSSPRAVALKCYVPQYGNTCCFFLVLKYYKTYITFLWKSMSK